MSKTSEVLNVLRCEVHETTTEAAQRFMEKLMTRYPSETGNEKVSRNIERNKKSSLTQGGDRLRNKSSYRSAIDKRVSPLGRITKRCFIHARAVYDACVKCSCMQCVQTCWLVVPVEASSSVSMCCRPSHHHSMFHLGNIHDIHPMNGPTARRWRAQSRRASTKIAIKANRL